MIPSVRRVLPLLVLAACDHTTPFTSATDSAGTPFLPGNPARLTYDSGTDSHPTWLPDGSAFLYTQAQTGRQDHDECLAVMPATGGTVIRTICAQSDTLGDTLNVYESAAVFADGRMAYVRSSMFAFAGRHTPDNAEFVLATYANPNSATRLEPLSYFGPSNRPVDMVSDIHWSGASTLVFLAERVTYTCANFGCTLYDTATSGLDIQRIDLGSPAPALSLVPSTDQATSVASGGRDTIYYTLAGSGQVHRRVLSSDADTVVADFGAAGTDLSVAGTRVAAVVGQQLRVVDLAGGLNNTYSMPATNIHRPALSPDGHRIIAEVAPIDTLTFAETSPTDLWMWTLP